MKFLSVCSGIDAASVAWEPLGWECVGFSEINAAPAAVLAHHWPEVPNLGDLTKYERWEFTDDPAEVRRGGADGAGAVCLRPDVIVGGTPCQAFSVAGLRQGLADPRGNLTLVFLGLLARVRPRWVVWENVPGVLSDASGAFGAFLGGLGELGYGFAYRILDAQYYGVAQKRRRVFVIGCAGGWAGAGAVLFEPDSLRGDPAPRREAGKAVAALTANGVGGGGADASHGIAGHLIPAVAHTLRRVGFDASEAGPGRGTPLVPVHTIGAGQWKEGVGTLRVSGAASYENLLVGAYRTSGNCGAYETGDRVDALTTGTDPTSHVVAFSGRERGDDGRGYARPPQVFEEGVVGKLDTVKPHCVAQITAVRRLTPLECERLQGFPDGHTLVPYRGKQMADGPRYQMIGNSMAVPVMRWIGEGIAAVDALPSSQ